MFYQLSGPLGSRSPHLRRVPGGSVGSLGTAGVERHRTATGHGVRCALGAVDTDAMRNWAVELDV